MASYNKCTGIFYCYYVGTMQLTLYLVGILYKGLTLTITTIASVIRKCFKFTCNALKIK